MARPAREFHLANRWHRPPHTVGELLLVLLSFSAITVAFFYPMSLAPGEWVYRPDNGDGHYSIWNVAWVAHALLDSPRELLNANIFHPHRGTLAYSELNLTAGLLATPAYWLTRNPYAAHNTALLASFVLSGTSTYYLCRHLVHDRRAAAAGALCFAFCPHVIAHLLHIQLLMTAWLPLSLLAFHRLADNPSYGRGAVLGLAMVGQLVACQYYAVFDVLLVGCAVLTTALWRSTWRMPRYWMALGVAALVAAVTAAPVVWPFVALSQTGFVRTMESAQEFSADWRAYFASAGLLHEWMLPFLGHWKEVLFPGFACLVLGGVGIVRGWKAPGGDRETVLLYGAIAVLALWSSFGPAGGLYRLLYAVVPGFSLMRAASRFGLLVVLALSVLSALGTQLLLARARKPAMVAALLLMLTAADRVVVLAFERTQPFGPAYHVLATLPDGAVLELPVYSRLQGHRRSVYMLNSTVHWKPLVDAYSDYIPHDFTDRLDVLGDFPTEASLRDLARDRVRYAVIHLDPYEPQPRADLMQRLETFAPYLEERYRDAHTILLEIVAYPQ